MKTSLYKYKELTCNCMYIINSEERQDAFLVTATVILYSLKLLI